MNIFDFFFGHKQNKSNNSRHYSVKLNRNAVRTRNLALEPLETRDLLSVTTGLIDDSAYAELREQYPDFNLPAEQSYLNVMTVDLDEGASALKLEDLKSAIAIAGTNTTSDLILVKTTASANSITYTSSADEITININSTQYGSVIIIGWGEENLTLDANQMSRVVSISGNSTIVNLGGLTIQNGEAPDSGGGISNYGTLTVTNSTISENTASFSGGGISNYGTLTITNSTISGNTASSSGGGISNYGTLTVTNSTISGNTASYGGGIGNGGSETILIVTNSTISGNTASSGGGGVYNSGTLTVTNSTISGNTASISGGGIYHYGGALTVTNSAILGNTASSDGGGICNLYGTLTVTNSTIAGNNTTESSSSGGGIYNYGSSATTNVYNTIVASNSSPNGKDFYLGSGYIYAYNSLSSYTEWDGGSNIVYDESIQLFMDAANGDYRLALGSQAIDKGGNQYAVDADGQPLTVDLANAPRIQGGVVDIGAYEFDIQGRLPVPEFTLSADGSTVNVTISEVENASSYTVLYQMVGSEVWRTITDIQGTTATFVGNVGQTYNVRVQANGNEENSDSNYSDIQSVTIADDLIAQNDFITTTLNTPAIIDYRANDEATDWSVVTVQFSEASHGEYAVNEDGTITYIPASGFYGADTIGYALLSPTGKMALGSIVISIEKPILNLDIPTDVALSANGAIVTTTWGAIENASGYTLECVTEGSESKMLLTEIQGTTASFMGEYGKTYTVRIKAVGTGDYSDSEYSETVEITLITRLSNLTLSTKNPVVGTTITTTLTPSDATADYQWFSGETLIEGATGSTFIVTEDQIGQTITCVATGTGDFEGTVSMTTAVVPVPVVALDAPADVALSVYNATVTASWSAVENASSYTLEYKPVDAENWTALPGLEDTTASFVGVSGTMYNVRVKAVGTGDYSDSSYTEINTDKPTGPVVAINANKVTVSWVDDSPAADSVRYRVAGTTRWTVKKLNAGITEMSFNATIGANYEIEVLLDQQENNVLQGSAIVLDQPRLTSIRNELKDDTFQVNVTNYAAKNLAANVKQAIVSVNGVMTTLKIADQQGETALANGGKVAFSNGLFTFSEMNSNTSYKVMISFSDGHSVSKTSTALTVKTLKSPYLPPVIVSANAVSDTAVTVTWETAYGKKSDKPAQKYTVQYSTDGNKWTNATTGATGNSYTIQRLKGGVEYQVRVLATKDTAFEASAPSGVLSAQTLTLPKTVLDRTSIKDDTFKLDVTNYATSNLVSAPMLNVKSDKFGEAAIAIQNGSGSATFENGMVAAFENGALTFTNVPSNTQQKIQVNFSNGVCTTAWTAALTVKTTIAPYNKPVITNATAVNSTSVLVEWDTAYGKNSTVEAPSYTVQYTTDGTRWTNANTRVVGTSFTIPNLKPNTSYRVAVIANKDARFNASQPSESWEVRTL